MLWPCHTWRFLLTIPALRAQQRIQSLAASLKAPSSSITRATSKGIFKSCCGSSQSGRGSISKLELHSLKEIQRFNFWIYRKRHDFTGLFPGMVQFLLSVFFTKISTYSVVIGFILSLLGTIVLIFGQLVLFAGMFLAYIHFDFRMLTRFIIVLYVLGTIVTLISTGFLLGVWFLLSSAHNDMKFTLISLVLYAIETCEIPRTRSG